ncbi:MAG: 1-acyl-sn-glycerol-3-phosphate acyltransferase, partial [Bacilli bacterium]|nr:1-acyl-sn-glycerol-3-phosphate acyltransferase [Bacilli bacterium]
MKKKIYINEPVSIWIYKFIAYIYVKFFLHYKFKGKYRFKKDEKIVVLSNHQTDMDPFLVRLHLNRYMYSLSSDNIYSRKWLAKQITKVGGIPKRKGIPDFESIKTLLEVSKDGGSVLIFPEGNRSYAEFQFYIADNFASLIKKLKSTLVLYNIHGGFGKCPRFGRKHRKGKFYGEVRQILKYEEYKDMPVSELTNIIRDNIRVFDSESGELYKNNKKAEYLERMFFVCPKCGTKEELVSQGNVIRCNHCGLEVNYNEDLSLSSKDKD